MPRIVRGSPPSKQLKRYSYGQAITELLRDFGGRCAYSMQHSRSVGNLTVDHFDPRRKRDYLQDYRNLFPSTFHCNRAKSNNWPTKQELELGCRFLNPCEENDYGETIFEDLQTHKLIGTTRAATWHIRMCGLNAQHLIDERAMRSEHYKRLRAIPIAFHGDHQAVADMARGYRELIETMIPEIPAPPAE